MPRRHLSPIVLIAIVSLLTPLARAQESQPTARQILLQALTKWADIVENKTDGPPRTLVAHLKLAKSDGLSPTFDGLKVDLAFQAPDRLRISGAAVGFNVSVGRDRNEVW